MTTVGWGCTLAGLATRMGAGLRRRSGSADTGTLVPWYPEGCLVSWILILENYPSGYLHYTLELVSCFLKRSSALAEAFLYLLK